MQAHLRVGPIATAILLMGTLGGCGASSTSPDQASVSDGGAGAAASAGSANAAGSSNGAGTASGGGASAGAGSGDLPCEVQALVASKCQVCHKVNPPGLLLASADFRRPSQADPTKAVGALAVERLAATTSLRMPPAPLAAATDAEIAALSSWVAAGAMPASCGQPIDAPPDPDATDPICTSMKSWTGGNRESPLMRPGGACVSCHRQEGEGPIFAVAGTLFPTAHEPNDCNGVDSAAGAQVVITEANGTSHMLSVNQAGNFFLESRSFALPYQAKVVYQDRERVMVEAQQSGDCNDCHTQSGRENAPGRIFLP